MPYTAPIETGLFNGPAGGQVDAELSDEFIADLCRFHVRAAERYLRAYPNTPRFWEAARAGLLRYDRTCDDQSFCRIRDYPWRDVPTALLKRMADCKSLATFLVADMRVRDGVDASPHLYIRQMPLPDGRRLYHVVVRLPKGSFIPVWLVPYVTYQADGSIIVDPSRALGMTDAQGSY